MSIPELSIPAFFSIATKSATSFASAPFIENIRGCFVGLFCHIVLLTSHLHCTRCLGAGALLGSFFGWGRCFNTAYFLAGTFFSSGALSPYVLVRFPFSIVSTYGILLAPEILKSDLPPLDWILNSLLGVTSCRHNLFFTTLCVWDQ